MLENNKLELKKRADIIEEIKQLIVDSVHLSHVPLSEISETTVLFKEGLGLDSVDILEVVIAVEHRFGVKVKDAKMGQEIFKTIGTITDFVCQAK